MDTDSLSDDIIPMEKDITANGPPIDDDDLSTNSNTARTHSLIAKINRWARLTLPHIGLVLLLMSYTVVGACIFRTLELNHEIMSRRAHLNAVNANRTLMKQHLFELMMHYCSEPSNISLTILRGMFDHIADDNMDRVSTALFEAFRTQYFTRIEQVINQTENTTEAHILWTYPNSIFFSTTVITTIGYGNIAPVTMYGRMFCILFGIFGIPLLLVTIADIGKFMSDFLNFLYRNYRYCIRNLRLTSRKISARARQSFSKSPSPSDGHHEAPTLTHSQLDMQESDISDEDDFRIPVIMVLAVLLGYTALGGLLFEWLEGLRYFDAFYFCFITMATVGFGDIVPTKQMYLLVTMGYIVMGMTLTTMCIDLAGTEYIRKIHYLGQKMDVAKTVVGGAMARGAHMGETFFKETGYGFIRTAGGRLVGGRLIAVRRGEFDEDFIIEDDIHRNILYEPLSPAVLRQVHRAHIRVMPNEMTEADVGFVMRNKVYNRTPIRRYIFQSANSIRRTIIARQTGVSTTTRHQSRRDQQRVVLVAPFLWRESHV